MLRSLLLCWLGVASAAATSSPPPNILFLHVESTDGRLYNQDSPVPIPNIRSVQKRGVTFKKHYVNSPICAPSRSSMWCGRQLHNIPHQHNNISVAGAWNNYEGVGLNGTGGTTESDLMHVYLAKAGYATSIVGKTDWVAGDHDITTMIDSWSIYARFPYSQPKNGGFHVWGDCGGNLTVNPGNESAHQGDWNGVRKGTKWLEDYSQGQQQQPFFAYQGFNIVHPPYATSQAYIDRIEQANIAIPEWQPLLKNHPCDMQTIMKKGCALPLEYLNTSEHKRAIIAGYYAMIAEYDDMVGAYLETLEQTGLIDNTVVILSSDHGDMQMQHEQFYKMVAYEASSHVPLVIAGPGVEYRGEVEDITQMVDLFPTLMDIASVDKPSFLDGTSLMPYLKTGSSPSHPKQALSQFHGENLVMSWYMLRTDDVKYIAWGTGEQHPPQLFNLTADPDEHVNLALDPSYHGLVGELDRELRGLINYPNVTMNVATYNQDMAKWWMSTESNWRAILNGSQTGNLPNKGQDDLNKDSWASVWNMNADGCQAAWDKWIQSPPTITPCLHVLEYNWPDNEV
eukprot:TRINITY_DN12397_c4_g1_i1.p1 TRINITY_DN12397_c4_g1~~TRINITY_DN12397_c4_g1_i1.p1  ORF type:complete len:567 (+),score=133.77 TRINITY_DN12397_c4_g1_i1:2620-4320(+)